MSHKNFHWLRVGLGAGIAVAGVAVILNWQALSDQYALRSFTPSARMQQIIDQLQLTPHARAVMYRSRPQIDSKTAFNQDCQTRPHELELGCYYQGRIYILQIDNNDLAPEMVVVSAHELLHALWSDMPAYQHALLSKQLQAEYKTLGDSDLQDRMASYAASEPGEEANELHSILGTEVAGLPAALEQHYNEYFHKRSIVTASHAAYEAVFTVQRQQLEQDLASIREKKSDLAVMNRRMESLKAAGSISAYNALVPAQNTLVDDINSRISAYQSAVNEYNALSKSLDSQQITDTETSAE